MAKITVDNKQDDLRQTKELYAKTFVTLADVKAAELAVTTAANDYKKAQVALTVLEKYTHDLDTASKKSALVQAEQKLERTRKENASNLSKTKADMEAKEQKLALMKRQFTRLQEQLEACTIKAPADGMVVYAPTNSNFSNTPIGEGTAVRERQVLLRLPDTSAMKAVIKVNESQVGRLNPGQHGTVKITGVREAVPATVTKISPVADSSQRWANPDLREYPVELTLETTPPNLKPGIGVPQAEILVETIPDAQAVPLAALYAQESDSFVFVKKGDGVEPRRVKVGEANETQAQILEGAVADGEQVLLLQPGQGGELLEKANIHLAPPEHPKRRGKPKGEGPPKVPQAPQVPPAPQPPQAARAG